MKKRAFILIALWSLIVSLLLIAGCESAGTPAVSPSDNPNVSESINGDDETRGTSDDDIDGKLIFDYSLELEYADNFAVDYYKGGYIIFKDVEGGREYLIVPENKSDPENLPKDLKVLHAPITNLYIDSSAMVAFMTSVDSKLEALKLVTNERDSWYLDDVVAAMDAGKIKYAGKYNSPDYEMLVAADIQLCVCTTMANSSPEILAKYDELGIPYFVESSSKENHPLARMEWMKLMGIICGKAEEANTAFNVQKEIVDSVSSAQASDKTVAIFYYSNDGTKVYIRNANDYIAVMLKLAGGVYVAEDLKPGESGNTTATLEELFEIVCEADYIFYMNYYAKFTTLEDFIAFNEINKEFKAVKDKKVWYTSPDFSQKANALGDIISDMHKVLVTQENIDTDYFIYMK